MLLLQVASLLLSHRVVRVRSPTLAYYCGTLACLAKVLSCYARAFLTDSAKRALLTYIFRQYYQNRLFKIKKIMKI